MSAGYRETPNNSKEEWFLAIRRSKLTAIQALYRHIRDIDTQTSLVLNDVEHTDVTGLTIAAHIGSKDIVRWFLNRRANPNASTNLGWRPIHFAAKRGHVATVDILVSKGADINAKTLSNETAISLAQSVKMWDTVRKLIELGAAFDVGTESLVLNQFAPKNYTTSDIAVRKKNSSCYDLKSSNDVGFNSKTKNFPTYPSSSASDRRVNVLAKQIQFQNFGYDNDLARQKWDLVSKTPSLPMPFPSRYANTFANLVKKVMTSSLPLDQRLSAASELVDLLDSISASGSNNKQSLNSHNIHSVENYLRALEMTVCERHCPAQLVSPIADICTKLVVLFNLYAPKNGFKEAESPEASRSNLLLTEYKVAYVTRMLRSLSRITSYQSRSGILSYISRILVTVGSTPGVHDGIKISQASVKLIAELFTFADALYQPSILARLTHFMALVGALNPSEFGARFPELSDILIGWCVDPASNYRSAPVRAILEDLSHDLSRWWFDVSQSADRFLLTKATCGMMMHLLEDADASLRGAFEEFQNMCKSFMGRRGGGGQQGPFPAHEISQKFISANLYFAALAAICAGVQKYVGSSPKFAAVLEFASMPTDQWKNRLMNVLHTLDRMSSVVMHKAKPNSSSRVFVPPQYTLPLHTYGDISKHVHSILLLTISFMPTEEYFDQVILSYLSRPQNDSILRLTPQHMEVLCQLARSLFERRQPNSVTDTVTAKFKSIFTPSSLLQRMKTTSSGSAVSNLLLHLSSKLEMRYLVLDLCVADIRGSCVSMCSDGIPPSKRQCEILFLFNAALLSKVLKSIEDVEERKRCAITVYSQFVSTITSLHGNFKFFGKVSPQIRLAIWSMLFSAVSHGLKYSSSDEFSCIIEDLISTASKSLQEFILSMQLIKILKESSASRLAQAYCDYLHGLLLDPASPVRAHEGACFSDAIGLLISLFRGRAPTRKLSEIALMCACHPLPRIQTRGTDLLLLFGKYPGRPRSTGITNRLIQWYLHTPFDISTARMSGPMDKTSEVAFAAQSNQPIRTHGAFPSLPAAAGMLGILTRGAPGPTGMQTDRLKLLTHPSDWLRRMACLISPTQTDCCPNWFAYDTSAQSLVILLTSWSMVDYKLKVAPWANPVKTFLSIEATIHALIVGLTKRVETQALLPPEMHGFYSVSSKAIAKQSPARRLKQASLVLNFMPLLEKAIINAAEGFTSAVPPVIAGTHTFFKANLMTCLQWLNRVRMPLTALAMWIAPMSLDSSEASAGVVWNIYSLLRQLRITDPSELLNVLSTFGNPEKIILYLIQSLFHLKAADELNLINAYLKRAVMGSAAPGVHLFRWLHGLICMLQGNLDEGLACLSAYFESYPHPPTASDAFGVLSHEFARNLYTALLVRVGGNNPAAFRFPSKLGTPASSADCSNQGDTPPTKRKAVASKNGKGDLVSALPIRQVDVATQRLQALKKLSTWDNAIASISTTTAGLSSMAEQEDTMLSLGPKCLSGVSKVIRDDAVATVSLVSPNTTAELAIPRLDAEPSLSSLALEAQLLGGDQPSVPAVGDLGVGSWCLLTGERGGRGNVSVFLDACEPLLMPGLKACGLPTDSSRGVALNLLQRQLFSLDVNESDLTNYEKILNDIKSKSEVTSVDRLRFARLISNLLWTSGESKNASRVAAMSCLSKGLLNSVLEPNRSNRVIHDNQCMLNASVALQLFRFLNQPVESSGQNAEVRNFCQEVFDAVDANVAVATPEQTAIRKDASRLIERLQQFGRLASSAWVDGVPATARHQDGDSEAATSPSELQMRLLMFASHLSPSNASALAWHQMAHWCYERGQADSLQIRLEAQRILALPQKEKASKTTLFDALTEDERESLIQLTLPLVIDGNEDFDEARLLASIYTFLAGHGEDLRVHPYCIDDLSSTDSCFDVHLRLKFSRHLCKGSNLSPEAVAPDSPLLLGCASLATILSTRLYTLQSFAAQAYVTFLSIAGLQINSDADATHSYGPSKPRERIDPLQTTTATLRLLKLLNEPCRFLRSTVSSLIVHGTSDSSVLLPSPPSLTNYYSGPAVWRGCLQQILDRLGHPDPAVRQCLTDLLFRLIDMGTNEAVNSHRALAKELVFPAIVGGMGVDSAQPTVRTQAHRKLLTKLCDAGHSEMVNQVTLFILEMRRITVLWEELWVGVLTQHIDDLSKKVPFMGRNPVSAVPAPGPTASQVLVEHEPKGNSLAEDSKEVVNAKAKKNAILKLRYESLLIPTFSILKHLCSLTLEVQPQTHCEARFQTKFKKPIESTIEALKKFCTAPSTSGMETPVVCLQRLLNCFQPPGSKKAKNEGNDGKTADKKDAPTSAVATVTAAEKEKSDSNRKKDGGKADGADNTKDQPANQANRILSLHTISPRLATLSGSSTKMVIPLPGRGHLSLTSVGSAVTVYQTKTRPKRLLFCTEGGQAFPYLLKCLEDLRLDARVMDLMRLTNAAFRSKLQVTDDGTIARTYSVTPLGPKSGLIQMVQGATPLFTVYKRWQQRAMTSLKLMEVQLEPNVGQVQPKEEKKRQKQALVPPKPCEQFYMKLRQMLPPQLLSPHMRDQWPKDVLLKVFKSLESETPADLLTRELWASSSSMSDWWRVSQTFATSLGVTSAFGYLIGLGDRHLDNLLVDLTTGRLIHIDFNVCFDEGRALRVPERVPFRLTRILRHPLGPLCDPADVMSGGAGTFGAKFMETLRACRHLRELFHIHLQSFVIDPLSDWLKDTGKESPWSTFDLAYFGAYRGGCLSGSVDSMTVRDRNGLTKWSRVHGQMLVEVERSAGLMAAKFVEIRKHIENLIGQVGSAMSTLESNLSVWRNYHANQEKVEETSLLIAILKDGSRGKNQLAEFESHVLEVQKAELSLSAAKAKLDNFGKRLEDDIDSSLVRLTKWLTHNPETFCNREEAYRFLAELLKEYHDIARAYLMSKDSRFCITEDHSQWFAQKRRLVLALKEARTSQELRQLIHPLERSSFDKHTSVLLETALNQAAVDFDTLRAQHFIPSSFWSNSLDSILAQKSAELQAFVAEQDGVLIIPAFKLALIQHLSVWIHSMFTLEPLTSIDVLHQLVSTIACAFSVLDPSGTTGVLPFWAGQEADANSELQFFLTVAQFISRLVDLRSSLCNDVLHNLEITIREASRKDLRLIDSIKQFIFATEGAELLPVQVDRLLGECDQTPLSGALSVLHSTLLAATNDMESLCQKLTDYPITAPYWARVDLISRAIATLQSRCTVDQGATSLWGWRPVAQPSSPTTWVNEVYSVGMGVMLRVVEEIGRVWCGVREGKVKGPMPLTPYTALIEKQFINNLANRLAMVSESVLACGRLLLSLLEESGLSVRQAVFELERMVLPPIQPTLLVDRMLQMANTFALTTQPPEVHSLSAAVGALLSGMFTATSSYVHTALAGKDIHAAELHFQLVRGLKIAFEWLHDCQSTSETSLRNFLGRLEAAVDGVKGEELNDTDRELCELAEVICAVEYDRLGESPCSDEAIHLFEECEVVSQNLNQLNSDLSSSKLALSNLKRDYDLTMPATTWPEIEISTSDGKTSRLVDALASRLAEAKQAVAESSKSIDILAAALLANAPKVQSKAKRQRKANQNLECEVAKLEVMEQIFGDMEIKVIEKMRPYVRQLQRLAELCGDAYCNHIWTKWLTTQDAWLTTSARIVANFTDLLNRLTSNGNSKRDPTVLSLAEGLLKDCLSVRDELTPGLSRLLTVGTWAALRSSGAEVIPATLRELAFEGEEAREDAEAESDANVEVKTNAIEVRSPEELSTQAIASLVRLCRRLQGVDDFLAPEKIGGVLDLAEQAELSIRAAIDPGHLAAMFEGWTPWV